ncbi:MAG: PQQ-binding-like beta-propeller repeat protein [Aureliella sp.]
MSRVKSKASYLFSGRCSWHFVAAANLRLLVCLMVAGSMIPFPSLSHAEDWPHWMGPNRDNRWEAEGILKQFPVGGPKEIWSTPVAGGYSGPAVVGDRVFVTDFVTESNVKVANFDRKEFAGTERVLCLDAGSGEIQWKHEYPVTTSVSYPAGPRCTPVVDGDLVYTLGAEGNLFAFNRSNGEIVWKRDLRGDYGTDSALWGYASHPLIDGNKLICVVGGEGSHTVAFNKSTGKEIWKSGTAPEQGYSPPKIIEHGGKRQLILVSPSFVRSVDPESGDEYWTQEYGATSGSIIMTPIHYGDFLFVGGYSNRNLLLKLDPNKPGATTVFRDKTKTAISPVNVQPFQDGKLMYGMNQSGELMAVDIASGERIWSTAQPLAERPVGNGTAFIVENEGMFYMFCETGELVLGKMTETGFTEVDRAAVIEPTNNAFGRPVAWYPPAFANGRMYVRNDEKIVCFEMTEGR